MTEGLKMVSIVSPCELIGLSVTIVEDEVRRLFGSDPVHMTMDGFVVLVEKLCRMLEDERVTFNGEKREPERVSTFLDGEEIGPWSRRNKEWLFC